MTITLNGTTGIITPDLTSTDDITANSSTVLTSASDLTAGNLIGSLPSSFITTADMPAGSIINYGSITGTVADIVVSGTSALIASGSVTTTRSSSRIIFILHSGQIIRSSEATLTNPAIDVYIDGVQCSRDNNHSWYNGNEERLFLSNQGISPTLTAGSHSITIYGGIYTNNSATVTYNAQNRFVHLIWLEVAQ